LTEVDGTFEVSTSLTKLNNSTPANEARNRAFVTTHWSVVLAAGRNDTTGAVDALTQLCQTYWYPLYAYVRHRGYSPHDAQDLTQEFFARLLAKNSLAEVTRVGGKFRSFLLTAMNRFLVDEWRKNQAAKRGQGITAISLDADDAETRFGREPVNAITPETLYEQNWALALLEAVYCRLEREYTEAGKGELFQELKFCLTGAGDSVPYAELSRRLCKPENTIKTLVHRLRQQYRQLLREEVAKVVVTAAEIEEELSYLFRALSGC
jgi:RNA polymerase sigma factor (sigma-70 family)